MWGVDYHRPRPEMLRYVYFGTNNLENVITFYDAALARHATLRHRRPRAGSCRCGLGSIRGCRSSGARILGGQDFPDQNYICDLEGLRHARRWRAIASKCR